MKKAHKIGLSLVVAVTLNIAYADDTTNLGEVSVTATKTLQNTLESPASVSVVTAAKIEEKSVLRTDEALTEVAGAYVRSLDNVTPNSYSNSVSLRGIPQYYRTAVLLDGVVMNNAFAGGVNWSNMPVDDIERIEVVKGPFSSLYGGSAMGGVINVITKEPTKRELIIKTGYGSNNFKNFEALYKDKITDKLKISINLGEKSSDGYINSPVTKTPTSGTGGIAVSGAQLTTDTTGKPVYIVGDKGKTPWVEHDAGIKLFYDLDDVNKFTAGYSHHESGTGFDHLNTYLTDSSGNPVTSGSVQLSSSSKATLSQSNFLPVPTGEKTDRFTLGYDTKFLDDVKLKANADYSKFGYWYLQASSNATSSGGAGTYTDIPNTLKSGSIQLSFPLGNSNYFVIGTELSKTELAKKVSNMTNWTDDSSLTTVTSEQNGQNTNKALFLQDTIDITDNLVAYIGGRYDAWSTSGNGETSPNTFNYPERSQSQFSPKASLVYMPDNKTTFRTSVGEAFRAPLLSDLYSSYYSGSVLYQADANIKPETMTSWEVGFEHIFDTKTHFKTTYYENYLTNLIYSTMVSSTLNEKKNAGKAEIKGIEIEVSQDLSYGLDAFANFTYNHAVVTANDANPAIVGKNVTYTPQRQFNIGLNGKHGDWSGSIIGNYVSDITTNDGNTDTYKSVPGGYESYFTANAKIGYQIQKWVNASMSVNNIANQQVYQYYLTPGRTYYGELTFKF